MNYNYSFILGNKHDYTPYIYMNSRFHPCKITEKNIS